MGFRSPFPRLLTLPVAGTALQWGAGKGLWFSLALTPAWVGAPRGEAQGLVAHTRCPVKVPCLMDSAVEGKHTPSACAGFSDPLGPSRVRGAREAASLVAGGPRSPSFCEPQFAHLQSGGGVAVHGSSPGCSWFHTDRPLPPLPSASLQASHAPALPREPSLLVTPVLVTCVAP